ncbi:hypothetical protein GW17_00030760 [Ensete ventricosum]|nr:hypothetical protein GW17_00030760 [Ensete ventricosum]
MMGMENQQVMSHQVPPNPPAFFAPAPPQSSCYLNYLPQEDDALMLRALAATRTDAPCAIRRLYNMEQCSNQSVGCPSQETGLSTDHNTEISSVASRLYDDLDVPSSTRPVLDLENIWKLGDEIYTCGDCNSMFPLDLEMRSTLVGTRSGGGGGGFSEAGGDGRGKGGIRLWPDNLLARRSCWLRMLFDNPRRRRCPGTSKILGHGNSPNLSLVIRLKE